MLFTLLALTPQLLLEYLASRDRRRHSGYKSLNLLCKDAIAFRLAQALSACI